MAKRSRPRRVPPGRPPTPRAPSRAHRGPGPAGPRRASAARPRERREKSDPETMIEFETNTRLYTVHETISRRQDRAYTHRTAERDSSEMDSRQRARAHTTQHLHLSRQCTRRDERDGAESEGIQRRGVGVAAPGRPARCAPAPLHDARSRCSMYKCVTLSGSPLE